MGSKLTQKRKAFIDAYMKHGNQTQAYKEAGYKYGTEGTAQKCASQLVRDPVVKNEILRRQKLAESKSIATAKDVMEFFTKAMNGEIKDQFGLEASLGDRIRAGQELAKRTIDIENKLAGHEDTNVNIKIDWRRD